jgi:ribosome-associated heat shock protein Hsp15
MCETGRILVNGRKTKPSKELKPGDRVTLHFTMESIELDVLDLPDRKSMQKVELQDLYRIIPK